VPSTGWTPRIVPYGADQTVYLVVDRLRRHGSVYRETEVKRTDLETIIVDLMSGNSTTQSASLLSTRPRTKRTPLPAFCRDEPYASRLQIRSCPRGRWRDRGSYTLEIIAEGL
jgi:hypothetical protein